MKAGRRNACRLFASAWFRRSWRIRSVVFAVPRLVSDWSAGTSASRRVVCPTLYRTGGVDGPESAQRPNKLAGRDAPRRGKNSRAAVILGNDALVAARPAPPAELSRACAAAGFDIVVPPSWGDELVAQRYMAELESCPDDVVLACTCARVASLLAAAATANPVRKIVVAAPPVAAARYLRLVYGESLLITYVGDCPSANDASINARFTPAGFFASLHREGITLDTSAAAEMDDADAERWRRHRSLPGGLPARRFLARAPVDRLLRDVDVASVDPALWEPSRSRVLLDLAAAARCACGGNRSIAEDAEPSRSVRPILVPPPGLDLRADTAAVPVAGVMREGRRARSVVPPATRAHAVAPPSTASPIAPIAVKTTSAPPVAASRSQAVTEAGRTETVGTDATGGQERRTESSVAPTARQAAEAVGSPPAEIAPSRVAPARPASTSPAPLRPETARAFTRSEMWLIAIPPIVLALSAALGAAAYFASATPRRTNAAAGGQRSTLTGETARGSAAPAPRQPPFSSSADSARANAKPAPAADSPATTNNTTPPRRPRAKAVPEVVPGWLPQGHKAWTPRDTIRRGRPDSSPLPPKRDTLPDA